MKNLNNDDNLFSINNKSDSTNNNNVENSLNLDS